MVQQSYDQIVRRQIDDDFCRRDAPLHIYMPRHAIAIAATLELVAKSTTSSTSSGSSSFVSQFYRYVTRYFIMVEWPSGLRRMI